MSSQKTSFVDVLNILLYSLKEVVYLNISKKIAMERKRQGLTQKELAVLAGVSLSTIQRLENPNPDDPKQPRLQSLYRVDVALWLNNIYTMYKDSGDPIEKVISNFKYCFEIGEYDANTALHNARNFKQFAQLCGVTIPDGMPGVAFYSLLSTSTATREQSINTKAEHDVMVYFRQLNSNGQEAAIDYTRYLTQNPEYAKDEADKT